VRLPRATRQLMARALWRDVCIWVILATTRGFQLSLARYLCPRQSAVDDTCRPCRTLSRAWQSTGDRVSTWFHGMAAVQPSYHRSTQQRSSHLLAAMTSISTSTEFNP